MTRLTECPIDAADERDVMDLPDVVARVSSVDHRAVTDSSVKPAAAPEVAFTFPSPHF